MSSPTSRTLKRLRDMGYMPGRTEHWNSFAGIRQDLFGWCDVVAIRADKPGVLGIQTTSRSNAAARAKKMLALPAVEVWLAAGNRAEVWSWAQNVAGKWILKREPLELERKEAGVNQSP